MSLFFRQILILRHYVNYIEEKQDKSSIFLSSSVHTQAGVDIKILSGHSSSNVLLPRGGASIGGSVLPQVVIIASIGGQRRRANKDEDRGDGHTPSTQSIRQTKTRTWCQTYRAAPNPFWHVSGGAPSSGHHHLVVASTLPSAEVTFHNRTAFTIGGKWGRRSSSSSFKASNGEIRSKVKASLPVIENHSP